MTPDGPTGRNRPPAHTTTSTGEDRQPQPRLPADARETIGWLLAGALLVVIRLRLLEVPLERDEGCFATIGQAILGGAVPYRMRSRAASSRAQRVSLPMSGAARRRRTADPGRRAGVSEGGSAERDRRAEVTNDTRRPGMRCATVVRAVYDSITT